MKTMIKLALVSCATVFALCSQQLHAYEDGDWEQRDGDWEQRDGDWEKKGWDWKKERDCEKRTVIKDLLVTRNAWFQKNV